MPAGMRPNEKADANDRIGARIGYAALATVVIIVVVGFFAIRPARTREQNEAARSQLANARATRQADQRRPSGGGGVQARDVDPNRTAARPTKRSADRSAAQTAQRVSMQPTAAPSNQSPRTFATVDEEIVWLQTQLKHAHDELDMRRRALNRVEQLEERANTAKDRDAALDRVARSRKLVEANFGRSEAKVLKIRKRLDEVRGRPRE